MDFDSPDVVKDFPGLYSSEIAKNDSDFSDDNHEKSFKADLIAKKKDKKDSKKDRGYAALEGESSQDEGDQKSPSKSKKSKSFKFPVKKSEKREKSREKDLKEKDTEKDKKKEKEKKEKGKLKEKKKCKVVDDESEDGAIFGVELEKAVERLGCLDGVDIPLPVRHCIDCIHTAGLSWEMLYKTAPVKSKLQNLRKRYNARDPVSSSDMDVSLASSLLQLYFRELPDHILTSELVARFEEVAAIPDVAHREQQLLHYLQLLPSCNRVLIAWLIVHFDHVTQHEDLNKMNAQSIAITFSPILQMSHRLLTAFLCHCKALFKDTVIHKYIPPLPPGSAFPDEAAALATELKKQEALLCQLHRDMSRGFVSKAREEQLWEVQRIVTHLKRKLKSLQKINSEHQIQKSSEENAIPDQTEKLNEVADLCNESEQTDKSTHFDRNNSAVTSAIAPNTESITHNQTKDAIIDEIEDKDKTAELHLPGTQTEHMNANPAVIVGPVKSSTEDTDEPQSLKKFRLQLENMQIHLLHSKLQDRLDQERRLAATYRTQIEAYRDFIDTDSEASSDASPTSIPAYLSPEAEAKLEQLLEDNQRLTARRDELARRIMEEREACIKLSVDINYIELMNKV